MPELSSFPPSTFAMLVFGLPALVFAIGSVLASTPGRRTINAVAAVGLAAIVAIIAFSSVAPDLNWHSFYFLLFGGLAALFSIAVVLTSNVVRMAFYLILSLAATAGLFFLAGADFVAAMQLMIYVGGTLVLLIFGVMLTAQGPFITMKTKGGDWILGALVAGILLAFLAPAAFSVPSWRNEGADQKMVDAAAEQTAKEGTATELGLGLMGARTELLAGNEAELQPGMAGYLLPFEIVSVHLLVVLIGAAYLARAKRRASRVDD